MADSRHAGACAVIAVLLTGCSCSEEESNRAGPGGNPTLDAAREAPSTDALVESDAPGGADADADSGPTGPTRGNCGQTAWNKRFGGSPAERALGDERATGLALAP